MNIATVDEDNLRDHRDANDSNHKVICDVGVVSVSSEINISVDGYAEAEYLMLEYTKMEISMIMGVHT